MFYSKKTGPSRRPPLSPTTTARCRSRWLPASAARSRRQTSCCATRTGPDALLDQAEALVTGIEPDFLWECVGDDEFSFADFANEYFRPCRDGGRSGCAAAGPAFSAGLFPPQRQRPLPQGPDEILQAALAGLEKKRQQALTIERMVGRTQGFFAAARVPADARSTALQGRPQPRRDQGAGSRVQRNRSLGGAPAAALRRHPLGARLSPAALPARTVSARHDFPAIEPPPLPTGLPRPTCGPSRSTTRRPPRSTTPFRCRRCPVSAGRSASTLRRRRWASRRVAARRPRARKAVDRLPARQQDHHVAGQRGRALYPLPAGERIPAISLYLTVTPELEITAHESRIEIVPVVANLRHHDIEPLFNEQTIAMACPSSPFATSC
jgi:exoribonuclease-2